jgi:hypothetical protein
MTILPTERRSYAQIDHRRKYQHLLPERMRLTGGDEPAEEWWPWRGAQVHLDRFAAPGAPLTVVALHGVGGNGRLIEPAEINPGRRVRVALITGRHDVSPAEGGRGYIVTCLLKPVESEGLKAAVGAGRCRWQSRRSIRAERAHAAAERGQGTRAPSVRQRCPLPTLSQSVPTARYPPALKAADSNL